MWNCVLPALLLNCFKGLNPVDTRKNPSRLILQCTHSKISESFFVCDLVILEDPNYLLKKKSS